MRRAAVWLGVLLFGFSVPAFAGPNLAIGHPSGFLEYSVSADEGFTSSGAGGGYRFMSAGTTSNFYVGAYADVGSDPHNLPNSGIRGTILVVSQQATGCLSYWVDDDAASNLWGQVGYYICNGTIPVAFYQIWNLNDSAVLATGTFNLTLGSHQFSMYSVDRADGGDTWAFALDGKVYGTYNMESNVSSSTYGISADGEEGYVNSAYDPAKQVEFSAIQTLASSTWSAVQLAIEPWACGTHTESCWGIQGNIQNSSVLPDGFVTGGTSLPISVGAKLWVAGTSSDSTVAISARAVGEILVLGAGGSRPDHPNRNHPRINVHLSAASRR